MFIYSIQYLNHDEEVCQSLNEAQRIIGNRDPLEHLIFCVQNDNNLANYWGLNEKNGLVSGP